VKTIETENVQLVVLNSFEFAAMVPRRRMRLLALLLRIRDFCKTDVAVGLRRDPVAEQHGAVAFLRFQSSVVTELGEVTSFTQTSQTESEQVKASLKACL
jgi:hypothetical protein